jgi:hypothetical protein
MPRLMVCPRGTDKNKEAGETIPYYFIAIIFTSSPEILVHMIYTFKNLQMASRTVCSGGYVGFDDWLSSASVTKFCLSASQSIYKPSNMEAIVHPVLPISKTTLWWPFLRL